MSRSKKLLTALLFALMATSAFPFESFGESVASEVKAAVDRAILEELVEETTSDRMTAMDFSDIFWKRLRQRNVTLLNDPKLLKKTGCHEEWSVYGTHCEIQSLTAFAKKEKSNINEGASQMAKSINQFGRVIFQALKLSSKFKQQPVNASRVDKTYAKIFTNLSSEDLKNLLRRIKASQKKRSLKNCWKKIANLRASGLCAICSSRHASFIEEDRLLITNETCHSFLDYCGQTFNLITDFVVFVQTISDAFKTEIGRKGLVRIRQDSDKISKIAERIKRAKISRLINKYLNNNKTDTVSAELCSMLISVSKQPIALKLAKMLSRLDFERFGEVNKRLDRSLSRSGIEARKNWRGFESETKHHRMLKIENSDMSSASSIEASPKLSPADLTSLDSSSFFIGDVKVQASIDSSYTSYMGATGTTGNEVSAHRRHLPLNLTNLFP